VASLKCTLAEQTARLGAILSTAEEEAAGEKAAREANERQQEARWDKIAQQLLKKDMEAEKARADAASMHAKSSDREVLLQENKILRRNSGLLKSALDRERLEKRRQERWFEGECVSLS
jgi:hypothetical protein